MPRKKQDQAYDLNLYKELTHEWRTGRITTHEMVFLGIIDSYITWLNYAKNQPEFSDFVKRHMHKKHGAWMTNKRLALKENMTLKATSNLVSRLAKRGYIFRHSIITRNGTKRYIKTCWTDAILELRKRKG